MAYWYSTKVQISLNEIRVFQQMVPISFDIHIQKDEFDPHFTTYKKLTKMIKNLKL